MITHFSRKRRGALSVAKFTAMAGLALMLPISAFANTELPQTQVFVSNGQQGQPSFAVTFNGAPRVSQVVTEGAKVMRQQVTSDAHQSDTIFWPAAALFSDTLSEKNAQLLLSVQSDLEKLKSEWKDDEELSGAVDSLSQFIASSTFKERLHVPLDRDIYLAGSKTDPLLNGNMTLLLPSKPTSITVLGAVAKPTTLPFNALASADDYIEQTSPVNAFGPSEVTVSLRDGSTAYHKVAYWNHIHEHVAPGALIFVPFQRLPWSVSDLNQNISRLLQHWVS